MHIPVEQTRKTGITHPPFAQKMKKKTETKERSIHPMKKNPAPRSIATPNPDDKMSILKYSNSQGNMSPLELAYHSRP